MRINFIDNLLNPTTTRPEYLAVVRVLFALWVLYESFGAQFRYFSEVGRSESTFTIFPNWVDEAIARNSHILLLVLQLAAFFVLIGLFTNFATWTLAITYLFLYSYHYLSFNAPVPWLYGWFPLIVLALSPSGERWSIDAYMSPKKVHSTSARFGWPLDAMRLYFIYIYFSAGISKLLPLSDVLDWVINSPAQEIFVYRYPHSFAYYLLGRPLFDYSDAEILFSIGAFITLILELSIIVMFFTDRFDYVFLLLILVMHSALYLTGVPNFGLASLVLMSPIVLRKLNPRFFRTSRLTSF